MQVDVHGPRPCSRRARELTAPMLHAPPQTPVRMFVDSSRLAAILSNDHGCTSYERERADEGMRLGQGAAGWRQGSCTSPTLTQNTGI